MDLFVGQKFYKYEEVDLAIKKYETDHFVNLYKKECRTISAAKKNVLRKIIVMTSNMQTLHLRVLEMANIIIFQHFIEPETKHNSNL